MTAFSADTNPDLGLAALGGPDPLAASTPRELETVECALVRDAAAGDETAFHQLVERYQERVYHFCFQWLRDAEDAREACQDTFVRAYHAIGRYRERGQFLAWLYRIALNKCRDRHKSKCARQRRQTLRLEDSPVAHQCHAPSPDESAIHSSDIEKLRRGIQSLPPRLRAPVILCAVEGLSQEVCAEILNCSPRAIEGRLYRARRELARWWDSEHQLDPSRQPL